MWLATPLHDSFPDDLTEGRDRKRQRGEKGGVTPEIKEPVGKDKPEGDARCHRPFLLRRQGSLASRGGGILRYSHGALPFLSRNATSTANPVTEYLILGTGISRKGFPA